MQHVTTPLASFAPAPSVSLARSQARGFAWAALALLIFSGWFVITRFSVTHELRVWDIMALRFGVGFVVLAPTLLARRTHLPPRAWLEGLLFCLLWGLPFVLLVAVGLQLTSAAEAASIAPAAMPVFAGVVSALLLGERQGKARWFGYGIILTGLVCLVAAGARGHAPPDPLGLLALAGAAALWALYTIAFRRSGLTPVHAAALICSWSAVLFLPCYLLLGLSRLPLASVPELGVQILYQGVLMSCVAVVAFNRAVALLGPPAATAVIALLPAVASMLAIPVLGEVPTVVQWGALALIASGVFLAARRSSPRTLTTT